MTPEREYEINVAWNCDNMSGTEAITVVGELLDALHSANERADAAERILDETLHQAAAQLRSHQADTAKANARIAALEGALSKIKNGYDYMDRQMTWQECSSIAETALRPPQ